MSGMRLKVKIWDLVTTEMGLLSDVTVPLALPLTAAFCKAGRGC